MTAEEQAAAVDGLLVDLSVAEILALAEERQRVEDQAALSSYDPGYDLSFTRGGLTEVEAHILGSITDPTPFQGMDQLLIATKELIRTPGSPAYYTIDTVVLMLVTVFRKAWGMHPELGAIET
jgi:hypothetical protein